MFPVDAVGCGEYFLLMMVMAVMLSLVLVAGSS